MICIAWPAGTSCYPPSMARIASITVAGNAVMLARVCLTFPSSRKVQREYAGQTQDQPSDSS
jgi:hypothetical protein